MRAVSLDLFDTLVDLSEAAEAIRVSTRRLHAVLAEYQTLDLEAFLQALRAVDREHREPRYAEGIELPTEERFAKLAERLGLEAPELPARLTELHMGTIRRHVEVPEHHAHVLGELRRRAPVALCSNFSHAATARCILDDWGLGAQLDAVVISDDLGFRKPRREIFEAVASALATRPEEILHVGDSLRADIAGAASLGMRTAWITRCVEDPERALADYGGPRPDHVVRDLKGLPALLD